MNQLDMFTPINYVKYHYGDLVQMFKDGELDAMAHGCNCFCNMGSGIAVTVATTFPDARAVDSGTNKGDRAKLGTFTSIEYGRGKLYNAYTQFTYWDPNDMLSYDAVREAFTAINVDMKASGLVRLGIPRIGAVRAGGDWGTILNIIMEVCTDVEIHYVEYNGVINK